MKSLFFCVFVLFVGTVQAKEIPRGSDLVALSEVEIAAANVADALSRSSSTSLTEAISEADKAIAIREARTSGAQPVEVMRLKRSLLGLPTPQDIDLSKPAAGSGVPRQFSKLSLTIQGEEIQLFIVDEVLDEKEKLRHLTAKVLNQPRGYARFTVDDRVGAIVGTIQTSTQVYRIVPGGVGTQLVFLATTKTGQYFVSPAAGRLLTVERRHQQVEIASERLFARVQTGERNVSVILEGGNIGRISGDATVEKLREALGQLEPFTNVKGSEVLRIANTLQARGPSENRTILFEQLVNGIPVFRRNEITVDAAGNIVSLRASIVDSSWAKHGELISEERAKQIAYDSVLKQLTQPTEALEQVGNSRLRYQVNAVAGELVPEFVIVLKPNDGAPLVATISAISGEVIVRKDGTSALGDDFDTYVYLTTSGSPSSPGTGTGLVRYEGSGGILYCPLPPVQQGLCFQAPVASVASIGVALGVDWETASSADTYLCCEQMGVSGTNDVPVILNTSAASDYASYLPSTGSIVFATPASGFPGPQNVDTVVHEFMHRYSHAYNPWTYATNDFSNVFLEGIADAVAAVFAEKHTGIGAGSAWVWGDGTAALASGYQRDMTVSRDFGYLSGAGTVHERSMAISNYFYRLKSASGISSDRMMELLLRVAYSIDDTDADGLDLSDFQEAVYAAINYNETALIGGAAQAWFDMENVSNPVPAAPSLVDGSPLSCSGGVAFFTVFWSSSTYATNYKSYINDYSGLFYNYAWTFPGSLTTGIAYANFNTDARVAACNSSGCSSLSADNYLMVDTCP